MGGLEGGVGENVGKYALWGSFLVSGLKRGEREVGASTVHVMGAVSSASRRRKRG